MGHWCDKETPLFPNLCTLVWLIAGKDEYKNVLKTLPKINERLLKIKQMCERKQRMVSQQQVMLSSSIFLSFKNVPLPSRVPDWGIEYTDRPRTFKNSLHGLQCLLNILFS